MTDDLRPRFLVIGGGPGGVAAATGAAIHGAAVTVVESDIIGGAAHLWDCIPSKALVASSMRLDSLRSAARLGIGGVGLPAVDMAGLSERARAIAQRLAGDTRELLESQGVEMITGRARLVGPHRAIAEAAGGDQEIEFDMAVISTGSRPWEPPWARVDGERILTTRHSYHLPELPEHLIVIGSGVTGVEFVHVFASLGSRVTLLVSRQQVLPHRDPEVAAVLEEDFLGRDVHLLKGARASSAEVRGDAVIVETEDGRRVEGSHVLLAVGSRPNSTGLGLEEVGIATENGYVVVDEMLRTTLPHVYAAGDVTGRIPLASVAAMHGRRIARHALGLPVRPTASEAVAQAIFTEPEIASVGLEEADARAAGRKVRITKVPFAANPRALIQGNPTGFVKVISDPATHVVLGGTIVGHHASELIGILALAAQAGLRVDALVDTLMVHPSLAESLADAAD